MFALDGLTMRLTFQESSETTKLNATMSTAIVRVLIVEDHEAYREYVSSVVQERSDLRVVSKVADGKQALQTAEQLQPNLILLDIGLPGLNGIEVAREILKLCPDSRILFVSQESSEDVVSEAFSTGALGYVTKADAGSELMAAVNSVLLGEKFMSRSVERP